MKTTSVLIVSVTVLGLTNPIVKGELPREITQLFNRLDEVGRSKVRDAAFKDLHFDERAEPAWVLEEDAKRVVVLRDDLLPWTFSKKDLTRVPSSGRPQDVRLKSTSPRDFEAFCKELASQKVDKDDVRNRLRQPGPSYRALIAHAAWKKGLNNLCEQILAGDPIYAADSEGFVDKVWEDLAWRHYLRGVNLLMYANRKDVLPQLRLAVQLAPKSESGSASKDLLKYLEPMVEAEQKRQATRPAETQTADLTPGQKVDLYISQLCDVWCPQLSQPGFISPYDCLPTEDMVDGPPPALLRGLGYAAVPAMIKALDDDRPTRTVYHWRDFAHSRMVWRVSDFAWNILRDISKREFGYQRVVGFTFSYMKPEQKRAVIADVKRWYAETKNLSPDDRMMTMFSSTNVEDWMKAAKFFAAKKDRRPVALLVPKLKTVRDFEKGELCEVLASFGDRTAVPAIKDVLENAEEASDRISAAIGLWKLGDSSGVPVAIKYVTTKEQPYGGWDTPLWFLTLCHTPEAVAALKSLVETAPAERAGDVIQMLTGCITGDLSSKRREPAGCAELAEVLATGMRRSDEYAGKRLKDHAAAAFVLLRDGSNHIFAGRFVDTDPAVFDQSNIDAAKQDKQIDALLRWYEQNKGRLTWDQRARRLKVGSPSTQAKP